MNTPLDSWPSALTPSSLLTKKIRGWKTGKFENERASIAESLQASLPPSFRQDAKAGKVLITQVTNPIIRGKNKGE